MNLPRRSLLRSASLGLLAAPLAALLAGCAGGIGGSGLFATPAPRLAVFLVVDGLPQRQVLAYRDQLAPDGIARFLDRGTWFSEAHYRHAFTVTAAGHAAMLTGAYPHRSGIIGNEWRDAASGAPVYNTGDANYTYIGATTRPLDGTSPNNLKVETVGDVLRRTVPGSKVVGISGKDRGAILPAGHAGTAYMYMGESGTFASSTYYMKQHPAWVDAFNAAKPADRFFKAEWKPLLPEAAYARSLPDGQPWFGPAGGKLPMQMGAAADDKPGPRFYTALLASPFADALSLQFARAAIAGERLGLDDTPDILIVSLSGHDYVNHRWSAESRLSHDHLLQLDRMLQAFFKDLDETIGTDNYVVSLTADHGFMQVPEVSAAQGLGGGRVSSEQLLAPVNAELEKRFGVAKLAAFVSAQSVVLDRKLLAERKLDPDAVAEAARAVLVAQPAVGAAYTRKELKSGADAGAPFFEAMRRTWHPDISGDVQYVLKPHWMSGGSVATHGSPHPYDTQVPLLLWGPRWVGRGRVDTPVEPVDLAPTLAALLKVEAPSGNEGKPLPLPLSIVVGR